MADNKRINRSRACGRFSTSMNNRPDAVILYVIHLGILKSLPDPNPYSPPGSSSDKAKNEDSFAVKTWPLSGMVLGVSFSLLGYSILGIQQRVDGIANLCLRMPIQAGLIILVSTICSLAIAYHCSKTFGSKYVEFVAVTFIIAILLMMLWPILITD